MWNRCLCSSNCCDRKWIFRKGKRLFALFMAFVVGVGGKLAGIGCQLLKNERIYEALLQLNTAQAAQAALSKKL